MKQTFLKSRKFIIFVALLFALNISASQLLSVDLVSAADKVDICHVNASGTWNDMSVASAALSGHFDASGNPLHCITGSSVICDYLGSCVSSPEICDDGSDNDLDGKVDGADNDCTIGVCGDGTKTGTEQCDAGILNGTICNAPYGGSCTYCNTYCQTVTVVGPKCGDNIVNGSEVCDGNSMTCTTASGYSGTQTCNSECGWNACETTQSCGDGFLNGNEECDYAGIINHQSCTYDCTILDLTYCGDGTVQNPNGEGESEQCEGSAFANPCTIDGYDGLQACITATCQWNTTCVKQDYCGNGQLDEGEQCDGTLGDIGEHQTCNNCSIIDVPYCGDTNVDPGEQCEGQATSTCSVSDYNGTKTCVAQSCQWDACVKNEYCGNGQVDPGEQCDGTLGDIGAHQTCSDTCALVNLAYCGDGTMNGSEQCDDGNTANGDGCSSSCTTETTPAPTLLTICKFEDGDANTETTGNQTPVAGWNFVINDSISATTSENGCVTLNSLTPGNYTVTENLQDGWQYLSPANGIASTTVVSQQTTTLSFYNYRFGSISGNVLQDGDGNTGTTGDQTSLAGWLISLYNGGETPIATTTSDGSGNYTFSGLMPGTYTVTETLQSGWEKIISPDSGIVVISGTNSSDNNFVNAMPSNACTSNCGGGITITTGGGGGGGGGAIPPAVLGVKISGSLTVEKTVGKANVAPGETMIPYSFTITNNTGALANGVKAVDTLPDGFVFPDTGLKTRTWDVGTLGIGESKTFQYFVNSASSINSGVYTNKLEVDSLESDPVIVSADITVKAEGKVLGVKILAETGFDPRELAILVSLAALLFGTASYLRRRNALESAI